jgi:tetratricopeptide (TPR) repeat protein
MHGSSGTQNLFWEACSKLLSKCRWSLISTACSLSARNPPHDDSLKETKMSLNSRALALVLVLAAAAATSSLATAAGGGGGGSLGSSFTPAKAVDPDYAKAEKAIEAKDWDTAIDLLTQAVARDEKNPDIYNYLGFAERNRGNMDIAFKYYDRALLLNPKHRGAHEYLGEAYLLTGNLQKAEEHLAALDKLCFFPCSEYRELKEKIAGYKQKQQVANKPS